MSINSSGYRYLSENEKQHVHKCYTIVANLADDENTYMVNAGQVKECLAGIKYAVVYSYLHFCRGEHCVSPLKAEELCNEKGYRMLLISGTYEELSLTHGTTSPSLAIDPEAYGTDNYQKMHRLFYDELTGVTDKERGIGSFYVFKNGRFIKTYNDLKDLPNIE